MNLSVLNKLDFSNGEIKVYQALFELGSTTLNNVQQQTGIERRNIQDILNKLIKKGLVTYIIEKGKRTYQPAHPNILKRYIAEKESQIRNIHKEFDKQLPLIIETYKNRTPTVYAEIFRGKEGLKSIAEEMLNYHDVYFIGGGGDIEKNLPHYTIHYNKQRIKRRVMWHDLIQEGTLMSIFKNIEKLDLKKKQLYEFEILPSIFKSPHNIVIYGDKVANVLWAEEFFATVIQNRKIAENYFHYFELLWKIAKK